MKGARQIGVDGFSKMWWELHNPMITMKIRFRSTVEAYSAKGSCKENKEDALIEKKTDGVKGGRIDGPRGRKAN